MFCIIANRVFNSSLCTKIAGKESDCQSYRITSLVCTVHCKLNSQCCITNQKPTYMLVSYGVEVLKVLDLENLPALIDFIFVFDFCYLHVPDW
jgi:hypothetical protein